jgi:hypothetical protein
MVVRTIEAVRLAVRIVTVIALLAGAVFFFQGIGVIPGSFMTGRGEWAIIGAALVAGAGALFWLSGMEETVAAGHDVDP